MRIEALHGDTGELAVGEIFHTGMLPFTANVGERVLVTLRADSWNTTPVDHDGGIACADLYASREQVIQAALAEDCVTYLAAADDRWAEEDCGGCQGCTLGSHHDPPIGLPAMALAAAAFVLRRRR